MKVKDLMRKIKWKYEPDDEYPENPNLYVQNEEGEWEETCPLCEICETARDLITGIECPKCGAEIDPEINNEQSFHFDGFKFEVVKETRSEGVESEEKIIKTYIGHCTTCNIAIALMPQEIVWNANHDAYFQRWNNDNQEEVKK